MWREVLLIVGVNLLVFWRSLKCLYVIDDDSVAHKSISKVCNNGVPVKIDVSQMPENERNVAIPVLNQVIGNFSMHPNTVFIMRSFWKDLWEHITGHFYIYPGMAHFFNMFFHMINCVLIYIAFGRSDISLLAALLFAVNPTNNQVSVWLSGRTYGIAASLLLAGIAFEPLIPIGYGLALYRCIAVLPLPLLYLFYRPIYLLALLPPIAYLVKRHYNNTIKIRWDSVPAEMKKVNWYKIIIVFKTLGYYILHSVLPLKTGMCHEYLGTIGFTEEDTKRWYKVDKFFFVGVAFLLATLTAYFMGYKTEVFRLIWFLVFIAQWLNIVVINHPITERYMYIANIGTMLFLARYLVDFPALAGAFLGYYGCLMLRAIRTYDSNTTFWEANVRNFPQCVLGHNQLGLEYINTGKNFLALGTWEEGLKVRPTDFRINYNVANTMIQMNKLKEAEPYLAAAENNLLKVGNYKEWEERLQKLRDTIQGATNADVPRPTG